MAYAIVEKTTGELGTEMSIMIESIDDLESLPDCSPDSRAYTADRSLYYIKNLSGTWDKVI